MSSRRIPEVPMCRCSECDYLEDCPSVQALEAGLTARIEELYDTDTPAIQHLLDTG